MPPARFAPVYDAQAQLDDLMLGPAPPVEPPPEPYQYQEPVPVYDDTSMYSAPVTQSQPGSMGGYGEYQQANPPPVPAVPSEMYGGPAPAPAPSPALAAAGTAPPPTQTRTYPTAGPPGNAFPGSEVGYGTQISVAPSPATAPQPGALDALGALGGQVIQGARGVGDYLRSDPVGDFLRSDPVGGALRADPVGNALRSDPVGSAFPYENLGRVFGLDPTSELDMANQISRNVYDAAGNFLGRPYTEGGRGILADAAGRALESGARGIVAATGDRVGSNLDPLVDLARAFQSSGERKVAQISDPILPAVEWLGENAWPWLEDATGMHGMGIRKAQGGFDPVTQELGAIKDAIGASRPSQWLQGNPGQWMQDHPGAYFDQQYQQGAAQAAADRAKAQGVGATPPTSDRLLPSLASARTTMQNLGDAGGRLLDRIPTTLPEAPPQPAVAPPDTSGFMDLVHQTRGRLPAAPEVNPPDVDLLGALGRIPRDLLPPAADVALARAAGQTQQFLDRLSDETPNNITETPTTQFQMPDTSGAVGALRGAGAAAQGVLGSARDLVPERSASTISAQELPARDVAIPPRNVAPQTGGSVLPTIQLPDTSGVVGALRGVPSAAQSALDSARGRLTGTAQEPPAESVAAPKAQLTGSNVTEDAAGTTPANITPFPVKVLTPQRGADGRLVVVTGDMAGMGSAGPAIGGPITVYEPTTKPDGSPATRALTDVTADAPTLAALEAEGLYRWEATEEEVATLVAAGKISEADAANMVGKPTVVSKDWAKTMDPTWKPPAPTSATTTRKGKDKTKGTGVIPLTAEADTEYAGGSTWDGGSGGYDGGGGGGSGTNWYGGGGGTDWYGSDFAMPPTSPDGYGAWDTPIFADYFATPGGQRMAMMLPGYPRDGGSPSRSSPRARRRRGRPLVRHGVRSGPRTAPASAGGDSGAAALARALALRTRQ